MDNFYCSDKHVQMLVYLLKAHNVKKIVISPGATNICLVGSIQNDDFFEVYSVVDERSAAYIACGLAAESGEKVALSCTGATASRNYLSGLTEAFYRKLPIIAITSTQYVGRVGHLVPQVIDRSSTLNDICRLSINVERIHCEEDAWKTNTDINIALLETTRNGGGPVHINLESTYTCDYSTKKLLKTRVIERINYLDVFPNIQQNKIGIFVGNHLPWDANIIALVEDFCEKYDAVVICDHTSNYCGKHKVLASILASQQLYRSPLLHFDLLIHIGEVSGGYIDISVDEVWRVSPDGEIRDTFKKLNKVFEMEESIFFKQYLGGESIIDNRSDSQLEKWNKEIAELRSIECELPFSNIWVAKQLIHKIPNNSEVHLGILNSLRSWNFFDTREEQNLTFSSNTGGFGIDGCVSTILGASFCKKDKLFFGVIGDLAFFYDMNSIGNRIKCNNMRLMVVNNGIGTEFKNYTHQAAQFGDKANRYMAAEGHFGNKSNTLIKNYAQDLGFAYISATNKAEFIENVSIFVQEEFTDKPIIFEVFTDYNSESEALRVMNELTSDTKGNIKKSIKNIIGDKGVNIIRRITE